MTVDAIDVLAKRRALDPCYNWKPTPAMDAIHRDMTQHLAIVAGGRSGKTSTCLIDIAQCLRGIHPYKKWYGPIRVLMLSLSRQQAAMVAQELLFRNSRIPGGPWKTQPMIPEYELAEPVRYVKVGYPVAYQATLKNGSQVFFSWSDVEDTKKRIQGAGLDMVYVDENTGDHALIIECRKRINDARSESRKRADPAQRWGGQMLWSGHGTEDNPAFENYVQMAADKRPGFALHRLSPNDNPSLDKAVIKEFRDTLSERDAAVHIDATESMGGRTAVLRNQWSDERHWLKKDVKIQAEDNLWAGYDPGMGHDTGILVARLSQENPIRLDFVKFWALQGKMTLAAEIELLKEWLDGRKLAGLVYDTVAKNPQKGDGKSLLNFIMEDFRTAGITPLIGFYKAQKRHWPGVQRMRHYLDPDPKDPTAPPLVRLNRSEASGCPRLRQQILALRGREETKFTGPDGLHRKDDEGTDCFRYLVMQRPVWRADLACGTKAHPDEAEEEAAPAVEPAAEPIVVPTNWVRQPILRRRDMRQKNRQFSIPRIVLDNQF